MADNDENCAAAQADCITNPEPLAYQDYGSYIKHSLSASYTMALTPKSDLRVFGGVNNILSDQGASYPSGNGNYYSGYGGGAGRYVYLGAQYSF